MVRIVKGFVHFKPDGDWIMAQEGEVIEIPDGAKWVKDGLAVPVDDKPPSKAVEMAVIKPGEVSRPPRAKVKHG